MSGSRPDRNRPSRLERRQQALLDKLNGLEQGLCRFETLLRAADEKEECTDHSLEPVSATAGGSEIALADPTITTLVQPPQHRHSQYQQDVRHDQHDSKRDSAVVKHFLNLTDGLEVLPDLSKIGVSFDQVAFVRIMSSHCEQEDYEGVLAYLDHNLLVHLALGHVCLVYDLGSRATKWPDGAAGIPRAIWWGIEWTRYALSRCWRLEPAGASLRGSNVQAMFRSAWLSKVSKKVKKKLRYYRLLVRTKSVEVYGVYRKTEYDGQRSFYRDLLWKCYPERLAPGMEVRETATWGGSERERFIASLNLKIPENMKIFFREKYERKGRASSN